MTAHTMLAVTRDTIFDPAAGSEAVVVTALDLVSTLTVPELRRRLPALVATTRLETHARLIVLATSQWSCPGSWTLGYAAGAGDARCCS
jgi:hypothetical protein